MAPHSSTLAWKIPWMEEPGRLQSMGSLRVGHNWVSSLSLFTFLHWRRKWQPTPVFLPGESQGRGSLVGCRLRGHTESDTTELTAAAAATLHLYVDGNNPEEREIFLMQVKEGRIAGVMRQYFSRWGGSGNQGQAESLTMERSMEVSSTGTERKAGM